MADRPVTELTDAEKKEFSDLLAKFFEDKSISTQSLVVDIATKINPKEDLSSTTQTSLYCRWGCWPCQNPPPNPCSPWGLCWDCR